MVFSVPVDANKLEVKSSIEKIFSVKVVSVNTILLKGKVKRFKGVLGRRSNTKKAIVTLAPGNTIDLSAGV
jgi:large subunit ribosomal protein L23